MTCGLLVPLFSLRSARGWGIGEIGDIAATAHWLESAGMTLLQLLPINELPLFETDAVTPSVETVCPATVFVARPLPPALSAQVKFTCTF